MQKVKELIYEYWQVSLTVVVLVLISLFLIFKQLIAPTEATEESVEPFINQPIEEEKSGEEVPELIEPVEDTNWVMVDIKGFVNQPGVYEVLSTSRVQDVVELAGGVTAEANLLTINLAQKVQDQMVIYVGGEDDQELISSNEATEEIEGGSAQAVININLASKEELMQLNSIGEVKAESIIQYREENGPFNTIEDLMNVSGIGEKTFENLKENLTV